MNGFDFGWFFGVLKAPLNISLINPKYGLSASAKAPSKDNKGLLYFKQFPVSLSSSAVVTCLAKNLTAGPLGDFENQIYKSLFLWCLYSK